MIFAVALGIAVVFVFTAMVLGIGAVGAGSKSVIVQFVCMLPVMALPAAGISFILMFFLNPSQSETWSTFGWTVGIVTVLLTLLITIADSGARKR